MCDDLVFIVSKFKPYILLKHKKQQEKCITRTQKVIKRAE